MKTFSFLCKSLLVLALVGSTAAYAADAPKKLLVITVTKGFRHSSIPTAEKVLAKLAEKSKAFTVDYVRNDEEMASKMSPEGLKNYDCFVFANTTGILPVPDKDAFLNAIKEGKAFVGMHSASDTFHGQGVVDPYIVCIGGEFAGHGAQVGIECLVVDKKHPSTKHLGESYCIQQEEVYLIKNYLPERVHELLILDRHPNKKTEKGHFPVSWCKKHGEGNVWYTILGHREDVWENDLFQKHILGGILWALGLQPGDATPQAQPGQVIQY